MLKVTQSFPGASFQHPHTTPHKISFSSVHTLLILTRYVMAHEGGGQKSERNTKTQQSHLDVLQVTTVQVSCVSDLWDSEAATGIGQF
jgi:hypothetical protein